MKTKLWVSISLLNGDYSESNAQSLYNDRSQYNSFTDDVKGVALNIFALEEDINSQAKLYSVENDVVRAGA